MVYRVLSAFSLGVFLSLNTASAQPAGPGPLGHRHRHHHGGWGGPPAGYLAPFYLAGIGPNGPYFFGPPPPPPLGPIRTAPQYDSGSTRAGPIPPKAPQGIRVNPGATKPKRGDPERAAELTTLGDRLFRAGNLKRASERYDQAIRAHTRSASPRVRLAQIALVRSQFAEAARQLREAQAAEPGWIVTASDIQAIYAEPSDFAKQIAKLESHLQANPDNRDAWLVLGAQLYLSGRTQKAADVFVRLSDRKPEAVLDAFLAATEPRSSLRE